MKRVTYQVITHIPIIGSLVKMYTDVPELYSNYTKSDEIFNKEVIKPFTEYLKKHPDTQPTRNLLYKFLSKRKVNT